MKDKTCEDAKLDGNLTKMMKGHKRPDNKLLRYQIETSHNFKSKSKLLDAKICSKLDLVKVYVCIFSV